jgi:HAD superfamily hydrolase (TIGR01509 family)
VTGNDRNHTPEMTRISCRAILFDMDGTLVDSTAVIRRTWKDWAQRHSMPLEPILAVEKGRPNREVLEQFAPHLDIDVEAQLFLAAEESDIEGLTTLPGARDAVLAAEPGRWAVVTSAEKSLAEVRLRAVDLPIPDVLISADLVQNGKPDPECYLMAASHLKATPAECLVFEDAPAGVLSAVRAGMRTIGVGPYAVGMAGLAAHIRDFRKVVIAFDGQDQFDVRIEGS